LIELQVPAKSHQDVIMCINYYTEFFMQRYTRFMCVHVYLFLCYKRNLSISIQNKHYYKLANHAVFINYMNMNKPK